MITVVVEVIGEAGSDGFGALLLLLLLRVLPLRRGFFHFGVFNRDTAMVVWAPFVRSHRDEEFSRQPFFLNKRMPEFVRLSQPPICKIALTASSL